MNKTSLTQKLFGYYFSLSLITIVVLSVYSYYTSKNALISRTFDQLNSVKFEKERNIENYFIERLDEVNQISRSENWAQIIQNPEETTLESQQKAHILNEYTEKIRKHFGENLNYKNLSVKTTTQCFTLQLTAPITPEALSLADTSACHLNPMFAQVAKYEHATIAEDFAHKTIYIGSPIKTGSSGLPEAVFLLEIDMSSINSIMYNTNVLNGLGKTGEAYVVGADLKMKTSSRFKSNSINTTEVKTVAVQNAFKNQTGTGQYKDYRNITVLGSFGKINIPGLNWAILVEIDLQEAMIPIYTLRNSIIILSLIISLIIFGIVYIISRRVSSPILKLRLAAESISQGDYDTHLQNTSTDEIGDLTRAFNTMATKIKMQTEEIQIEKSKRITSVIDGQEQERQRLSRELHDGLGQRILAVKMKLERAENAAADLKMTIIDDAKNLLIAVSKEVVNMSENLMPPVLTQFGLVSAIENLCEDVRLAKDISIRFSYNAIPEKCDDTLKIYLYRIIQEALNNIIKHAEASEVEITFRFENQTVELQIKDNGVGFDANRLRKTGNGIYNMRERAEILGGTFQLTSIPQQGTTLQIKVPVMP
ncbi:MAG: ATP-binding protein [Bacteroidota bacterium]